MIIGIAGKARAGKDTLGSYIVQEFRDKYNRNFETTALAYMLKLMCKEHFGLSYEQLWGSDKEKITEYCKPGKTGFSSNPGDYWTTREIMQELGGFYRKIDYDFWVKLLFKNMKHCTDYIITDIRHINEVVSTKEHGGILIKIKRKDLEEIHNMQHESETALDNYPENEYDFLVDNDGTLEDLNNVAKMIVRSALLIEKLKNEGGVYNE